METIWVLGDQLNRGLGPLRTACPRTARVLMVQSGAKLARHQERFGRNARVARHVHAGQRLGHLPEVRVRADEVLAALDAGTL